MKRTHTINVLLTVLLFSGCGEDKPKTPGESETARREAAAYNARALRQSIIDRYKSGEPFYNQEVEKRLRQRWPAGSGHEEEFQKGMEGARAYYDRMLQGELNALESATAPSPEGKLEIIRKPTP